MPEYRRSRLQGGTFFFTVVTYRRRRILTDPICRTALSSAIREIRQNHPFAINAWVLLPDHLHCMWTLPPDDNDFSKRWGRIKAGFTKRVRNHIEEPQAISTSRQKRREAGIWQRRFWEHQIRDEDDYRRHINYIHYNPVKHRLVHNVRDWPFSTFHRYVSQGVYTLDWGESEGEDVGSDHFGEPD